MLSVAVEELVLQPTDQMELAKGIEKSYYSQELYRNLAVYFC